MTIFDDNFWWQFLMTILNENFEWQFWIIFNNFGKFWTIETIFDNRKDSPGGLTFETLITILTIENLNSDNLTIKSDTGHHWQFLRCFHITWHALRTLQWKLKHDFKKHLTLRVTLPTPCHPVRTSPGNHRQCNRNFAILIAIMNSRPVVHGWVGTQWTAPVWIKIASFLGPV